MLTGWLHHTISVWLRPALDAIWFGRHLPWTLRWRLLAFQPLSLLTNAMIFTRYLFRRPFTVDYIPISKTRSLRVLVFDPYPNTRPRGDDSHHDLQLRPLHVDCHAGGFIGGFPESSAPFCNILARRTGAVVIALSFRVAPVHPFPAAINDVDAAIAWLIGNAEARYGADPTLLTVSGFSSGGNMVLAATQATACHAPARTAIKASVTFYAPIDVRISPDQKPPMPAEWKVKDPMAFLTPLFDSYAGPKRSTMGDSARMNPTLAKVETLPQRMMLVVPKMDILVQEQLEFVERVNGELEDSGDTARRVEAVWVEDGFHGYLELPDFIIPLSKKMEVYEKVLQMIGEVHREHGWTQRV